MPGSTFGSALIGSIALSRAALAPRLASQPGPAQQLLETGRPLAVATVNLGSTSVFAKEALEHWYAIGFAAGAVAGMCAAVVALVMVSGEADQEAWH